MKKYLLLILLTATLFSGCKKVADTINGEKPEDRTSEALNNYNSILTSNASGWKAYLYPSGGGVYLFSVKFIANDRVTMFSDINVTSANKASESTYRLRGQQAPTLLFDTFSYIHLLADPDPGVNGGVAGQGYKSDFEFYFDKVVGDTINLVGNRLNSKLVLVKAKSDTEYNNFVKSSFDFFDKTKLLRTYFKRAKVGGVDCEVRLDVATKQMTFSYLNAGNLIPASGSFYIDGSTIVFSKPVTVANATFSEIRNFSFDGVNRNLNGTINGSAFKLEEAAAPLKYDLTAAAAFFNNPPNGFWWTSKSGFTIDGVADAYGVQTISGYNYLVFVPKYNPAYTRLAFFVNYNYAPYGPAPVASFPANGTIKFTNLGFFGTPPADVAPIVNNTTNKTFDANGFYVIKTGTNAYDWVSVTDARAWISWKE